MRRCLIALAVVALFVGCETHSDVRVGTTDRGAHDWLFYPNQNIYYCPPHKHYWIYRAGDRQWVQVEEDGLPRQIDPNWQQFRLTEYSGPYPYHHREAHLRSYRESIGK